MNLFSKGALSSLDRVNRGSSNELARKFSNFVVKSPEGFQLRMLFQDPNFKELKKFVLTEARSAQKEIIYDNERVVHWKPVTLQTRS